MIVRKRHSDINIYKEIFSFQKIFEKVIIKDTSNDLYRIVAVCHLRPEKCFCKQNGPFFIDKEPETQESKDPRTKDSENQSFLLKHHYQLPVCTIGKRNDQQEKAKFPPSFPLGPGRTRLKLL
jgi:hypothetical protein